MKIIYETGDLIYTSLCMLIFGGLLTVFYDDFRSAVMRIKMRRRLAERRKKLEAENYLKRHLDLVVRTSFPDVSDRINGNHLAAVSVLITVLFTCTGMRSYHIVTACAFGLILGMMPYIFLRIHLENKRHKASFEGEMFIPLLLSKYRLAALDMQRTLELLTEDENTPPICRNTLASILSQVRTSGGGDEIKKIFKNFEFAVKTNWSRMAAYNMAIAFAEGIDVSNALEDLVQQIAEARKLAEERKRLNSESGRLVVFMVPVSYMVSILLGARYVGIPFPRLIYNQFMTAQGFAFFILIIFVFLINIMLLKVVENRRLDY